MVEDRLQEGQTPSGGSEWGVDLPAARRSDKQISQLAAHQPAQGVARRHAHEVRDRVHNGFLSE